MDQAQLIHHLIKTLKRKQKLRLRVNNEGRSLKRVDLGTVLDHECSQRVLWLSRGFKLRSRIFLYWCKQFHMLGLKQRWTGFVGGFLSSTWKMWECYPGSEQLLALLQLRCLFFV